MGVLLTLSAFWRRCFTTDRWQRRRLNWPWQRNKVSPFVLIRHQNKGLFQQSLVAGWVFLLFPFFFLHDHSLQTLKACKRSRSFPEVLCLSIFPVSDIEDRVRPALTDFGTALLNHLAMIFFMLK